MNTNIIEEINDLNNQIKTLYLQSNTKAGPKIKKEYATMYSLNTKYDYLDDEKRDEIVKKIAIIYPDQFIKIQHGDVFENTSDRSIGYRANGKNMFAVIDNKLTIISLSYYPDDYGSIPSIFNGIEEFPLNYWNVFKMKNVYLDGSYGGSGWHGTSPEVPISNKLKDSIKPINKDILELIKINDLERYNLIKEYKTEKEYYYIKYKNKLYIFYDDNEYFKNTEKNYYLDEEETIIIDLPSRWGFIKASTWLLAQHHKSVIKVNHPLCKKERGEFEILD